MEIEEKYTDINNPFMAQAREVARLSNDRQQPTGAVIVANGKILTSASNKNPLSSEKLISLHQKFCIRHALGVKSGTMYWMCPGCAKKEDHAESRAAKMLISEGLPDMPVDVYLWGHWWCCDVCWKNMRKLPLGNVYLLDDSKRLFNIDNPDNILGKQFQV